MSHPQKTSWVAHFLLFVCGGRASKTFQLQANDEHSPGEKELIHRLPCVFIVSVRNRRPMIAVWKHLPAYAQNLSDDLWSEACKQEQAGRRLPQFMEAEHRERYLAQKVLQRRCQAIRRKCHSILGADH